MMLKHALLGALAAVLMAGQAQAQSAANAYTIPPQGGQPQGFAYPQVILCPGSGNAAVPCVFGSGGGGSNAAAGTTGTTPPTAASYEAFVNAGGNLTGVSPSNPFPVTIISGGGGGSNAAAGATGISPPASASYTAFINAGGNLTGASPSNPFPVTAASLPLPTGAATAAGLTTLNTTLGTPMQQTGGSVSISGTAAVSGTVGVSSLPALPAGANAIGSITNAGFGITGNLPAFAAIPTVNLGTLGGGATAANQVAGTAAGTSATTANPVQGVAGGVPLPATDANNASFGAAGTAPITATVGTPYAVGRSLQTNCTTGGTITFTEAGVGVPWIVGVGTTEIAHATTQVSSAGAAVCTYIVHY